MTTPPLIGISCYRQRARWGGWDLPAALLPDRYVTSVTAAGGIPVLLPPVPQIEASLARLDALVLAGGGDIDPAAYGAQRDPDCGPSSPERDRAELDLAAAALDRGPAGAGDLPRAAGDERGPGRHPAPAPARPGRARGARPPAGGYGAHEVSVAPGSRLASILNRTDLTDHLPVVVPTHHHQAVDALGAGLAATAWATDGTIEAAELDPGQHPFVVAVQWHPEAGEDLSLFRALAAAAARRSEAVPA